MSQEKIFNMINQRSTFSRANRTLCDYLLKNIETISTMTSNEVAGSANVGKATLFRFMHLIGYDSFSDFRMDLHNYALHNIRPNYWQMQTMLEGKSEDEVPLLVKAIEKDVALLGNILTPSLTVAFDSCVEKIVNCKQLGIVGFRSSKYIAEYFQSLLLPTPLQIAPLCYGEHFVFDYVAKLPENSVIFVIARWPYTSITVQVADYAKSLGHFIILLTNNLTCSITEFSDITILTPKEENRYSVIPFVAIVEALVDEISTKLSSDTIESIRKIDFILEKNEIVKW